MDDTEARLFLERAFAALAGGDGDDIATYWEPALTWYGLHRSGEQCEYQGLAGLAAAMAEPPPVVESRGEEFLECWPIGKGVIAARILGRRHAVATGEDTVSEFLFAVRVEDGRIPRVIDSSMLSSWPSGSVRQQPPAKPVVALAALAWATHGRRLLLDDLDGGAGGGESGVGVQKGFAGSADGRCA